MNKIKNSVPRVDTLPVNITDKITLKKEHRCNHCNKLLGIDNFVLPSFDIKCSRCGTVNPILKDLDRQVLITDKEGRILYINRRIEEVTGYSAKEILGNKPSLWGGQMKPDFYKKLWHQILVEKKAVAVELTNKHKDGHLYKVSLRIAPLLDDQGEVEFFFGIETVIRDGEKVLKPA